MNAGAAAHSDRQSGGGGDERGGQSGARGWLYFVTVAPGDTRFTASYEDHRRNVEEFNAKRRSAGNGG